MFPNAANTVDTANTDDSPARHRGARRAARRHTPRGALAALLAIVVLVGSMPGCAALAEASTPLTIVAEGRTDAVIAVDPDATADNGRTWERRAADDLAHYIELMTGARPAIADADDAIAAALAGDAPVFLVGELALRQRPALRDELEAVALDDPVLRADALAMRRDGNRVYLAGINDDSHYYAVVKLLNDWGCHWYVPTAFGEVVPERDTLSIDALDHAWAPPFEVRTYWLSWNASREGYQEFMRRNFKNRVVVPSGHTLARYVRDLVPEGGSAYNVPISSPETIEHVAAQVEERFAEGEYFSLGMEDGPYRSDYEPDQDLQANLYDKYFQTDVLTDAFMVFYNGVARWLTDRHPDAEGKFGFLAYINLTIPPQREIYAEDPFVAYLAPIDIDPTHPIKDHRSPPRQEYGEMMRRWSEVMDGRVVIYDYDQGMLVWRDLPDPSHQAFRHDVKEYRDAAILGVDTESRGATATTFLNLHLRGQLLWDPEMDLDAHLEAFYPAFYGPAGEAMRDYWSAIFQAWEDTIVTEHEYYLIPAVYTEDLVEELRSHLEAARSAVAELRERNEDELSRNERLYLERMDFTEKSFTLIDLYTTMWRAAATDADYAAASQAGQDALAVRLELAEMNPTFTTRVIGTAAEPTEPGGSAAWFPGEVRQYMDLLEKTDGTAGELIEVLPLEWMYRRDPNDTGLPRGFARQSPDMTYWNENHQNYTTAEQRKDYPTDEWEMIDADLYAQAQGILHPDWQSFTGFMWYKTEIELDAAQTEGNVHIHFPGLFSEAWLYVNGYLVEHRPQDHMWWRNNYRFDWTVDLTGKLEPGVNDITVRVHNTHHNGGLFRRPFLYRPVE